MTVRECYELIGGDYQSAVTRFKSDATLERFMTMFLSDQSMDLLHTGIEMGNLSLSFRSVHSLKGVAANLSFTDLQEKASALTEQLRYRSEQPDKELLEAVEKSYDLTVRAIEALRASRS